MMQELKVHHADLSSKKCENHFSAKNSCKQKMIDHHHKEGSALKFLMKNFVERKTVALTKDILSRNVT